MENKSEKEELYHLNIICYSPQSSAFKSMDILNQYFMSAICSEINKIADNQVSFKNKIKIGCEREIECVNSYLDATLQKNTKLNNLIDCLVIFIDLEYSDSLGELNKFLKNLAVLGKNDLKTYIMSYYLEEKSIKKNNKEENIQNLLDKYVFNNSDILKVNMNIHDELIKNIDKITKETLQDKDLIKYDVPDSNESTSHSICLII